MPQQQPPQRRASHLPLITLASTVALAVALPLAAATAGPSAPPRGTAPGSSPGTDAGTPSPARRGDESPAAAAGGTGGPDRGAGQRKAGRGEGSHGRGTPERHGDGDGERAGRDADGGAEDRDRPHGGGAADGKDARDPDGDADRGGDGEARRGAAPGGPAAALTPRRLAGEAGRDRLTTSCGPRLATPDGLEAQTCVLREDGETWARTYFRNRTGAPLPAVLTLMGPGGRSIQARCTLPADGEPGVCETPRERLRGRQGDRPPRPASAPDGGRGPRQPRAYTAVAEIGSADGERLLLRAGSERPGG